MGENSKYRNRAVEYNAENRPVRWTNAATGTVITMSFDSQGRRFEKKVTVAGATTLHHRYIYRGYFQIAAVDMTRSGQPDLWLTTWDPSQATATRPLAIQKDGMWFTYGYDLTKNICEVFGPAGYIRTAYAYAPFGAVTASGDVSQPLQWSSEYYDSELDLVYYNYRHYSPSLGRFLSRDPIEEQGDGICMCLLGAIAQLRFLSEIPEDCLRCKQSGLRLFRTYRLSRGRGRYKIACQKSNWTNYGNAH